MKQVVKKIFIKLIAMPKRMLVFLVHFIAHLLKNIWKISKKIVHVVKNPKLILTAWLLGFRKTKRFFKRLPKLSREYFFLIVMSAENNIHRLKRKNFHEIPSLAEFKTYQKHLRKKTFKFALSGALTVMLVIMLPGFFQNYFAHGKTWTWVQNNWSQGIATTTDASGQIMGNGWGTNWSNWQKYFSKSPAPTAIDADANGVTGVALHNFQPQSAVENGTTSGSPNYPYSGVGASTGSKVYATGGGASQGLVKLKKPDGANCGAGADGIGNGECASTKCSGTVCWLGGLIAGYHFDSSGADFSGNSTPNNITSAGTPLGTLLLDEMDALTGWSGAASLDSSSKLSGSASIYIASNGGVMSKSFDSGAGTVTWTYHIMNNAGGATYSKLDGSATGVNQCFVGSNGAWGGGGTAGGICTASAVVLAGTHTINFTTSGSSWHFDLLTITGPLSSWSPWDTGNPKFGGASGKTTTGTYFTPGSAVNLGSGDWTISAWVNMNYGVASSPVFIQFGDGKVVDFNSGAQILQAGAIGSENWGTNIAGFNGGTWHNVTLVKSGSNVTTYKNGAVDGVIAASYFGTTISYIGNKSNGAMPVQNIDEFMVFNRALSSAEITALQAVW